MPRTYLTVHYNQRNEVKALGARWDADARKWFVPDGLQLQAFAAWLPRGTSAHRDQALALPDEETELLPTTDRGIRLAQLMQAVSTAVTGAFPTGVWTRLEVVDVSVRNHVYLEVADRDADGRVLAKARAMIWAQVAQKILPEFQRATGMQLAPGIKLLVRARPTMHPEFGFGLTVDAVDPQYTLGDLEAKKREIRVRLKTEGLWDSNRRRPPPWDFVQVLVIAPDQAAGLGDFQAEADRLQQAGLCTFVYANSRFQGEGAAAGICDAANAALQRWTDRGQAPDAIAIIRGGGAVNDLAWLNEYCLARFICEAPAPVFTGIGHQRDSTVLDEVAYTAFDTPSKVIAGIESVIADRARKAKAAFEEITSRAHRMSLRAAASAKHAFESTRHEARRAHADAARACDGLIADIRQDAVRHVRTASVQTTSLNGAVRDGAHTALSSAKAQVPLLMKDVESSAKKVMTSARHQSASGISSVLERGNVAASRRREGVERTMQNITAQSRRVLETARESGEALFREVIGQGPDKTLRRGFAVVRDKQGRPITNAAGARKLTELDIQFLDGTVPVKTNPEGTKT